LGRKRTGIRKKTKWDRRGKKEQKKGKKGGESRGNSTKEVSRKGEKLQMS